jgi:hypothetical protein
LGIGEHIDNSRVYPVAHDKHLIGLEHVLQFGIEEEHAEQLAELK